MTMGMHIEIGRAQISFEIYQPKLETKLFDLHIYMEGFVKTYPFCSSLSGQNVI